MHNSTTQHKQQNETIVTSNLNTIVSEFITTCSTVRSYGIEGNIEQELIKNLKNQGYVYLNEECKDTTINAQTLKQNLRNCLEKLNKEIARKEGSASQFTGFTDYEWENFYHSTLCNESLNFTRATEILRNSGGLEYEDAEGKRHIIKLFDLTHHSNNKFHVLNQYKDGNARYDVTLLINGLPLVSIELKKPPVDIKEAYNQIERYKNHNFKELFNYIQLFIISSGYETRYYSNTVFETRNKMNKNSKRNETGYTFTSTWTDARNHPINDILEFAHYFLNKKNLFNILTRYCVFDSQKVLKVLRPYQICAVEAIINRVRNYKEDFGKDKSGGYIWHTTGSGKTLTSFKVSQLLTSEHNIKKVFFVVDRKDLDSQTIREFDNFQKGSVTPLSDKDTKKVREVIESEQQEHRIIVTTIQKLSRFLKSNLNNSDSKFPYNENCVFIFDECHRTQFGEMHKQIKKRFRKSMLFGFTGTPIFDVNGTITTRIGDKRYVIKTEDIFGKCLHEYKINNAITDHNVLPFYIHYMTEHNVEDYQGEPVYDNPDRMKKIARYILDNFATYTNPRAKNYFTVKQDYSLRQFAKTKSQHRASEETRFNSIFAVESIEAAINYYKIFKELQETLSPEKRLRITTIFSCPPKEDQDLEGIDAEQLEKAASGELREENNESTEQLAPQYKEELRSIIADYNQMFGKTFAVNDIQSFYTDVSSKLKQTHGAEQKLDILIVVNMFLTGFDAPKLNTIWVDRNLKHHGLIQALSRTNRIHSDVKPCGFVVSFRDLQGEVKEALELFASNNEHRTVELPNFESLFYGYTTRDEQHQEVVIPGYAKDYKSVLDMWEFQGANCSKKPRFSDQAFLEKFNQCLRARIILKCWMSFYEKEKELEEQYSKCFDDTDDSLFNILLGKYHSISNELRIQRDEEGSSTTTPTYTTSNLVYEIELVNAMAVDAQFIEELICNQLSDESSADPHKRADFIRKLTTYIETNPHLTSEYKELLVNFVQSYELQNPSESSPEELYYLVEEMLRKSFLQGLDHALDEIIEQYIDSTKCNLFENYLKNIFSESRKISNEGEIKFFKEPKLTFEDLFKPQTMDKNIKQRAEFFAQIERLFSTYSHKTNADDIGQYFERLQG